MTTLNTPTVGTVTLPSESSHLSGGSWCGHEAALLTATVVGTEQRGCGCACGGSCINLHYLVDNTVKHNFVVRLYCISVCVSY